MKCSLLPHFRASSMFFTPMAPDIFQMFCAGGLVTFVDDG